VFFREIWAMPPLLQAKLVRHFQERDLRAVDDTRSGLADARIVAGSSRPLDVSVEQATFRRELFQRLAQVSLQVPSLRDRKDDIGPLVEHFLARIAVGKGLRYSLTTEAERALLNHEWPGNVSELKECLECAVASCSSPLLRAEDLPIKQGAGPFSDTQRIVPLAEVEKQTIIRALERLNGDKVTAARMLGIGKTTLYRKLKEYGISEPWISRPEPNR
jgi:two-component system response regulator HydG